MDNKVYYTKSFKYLAVVMVGFSLFVLYAAFHASKDQTVIALLVATFFIVSSIYLLYQAFFVYFEYDDEALYFGKKRIKLEWYRLIEKGYSSILDMNYLRFDDFGTIWISSYMSGMDALSSFLDQKVEMLDREMENDET